jgi:monovalent cation:H+ antiporter-2, CPA2 family
MEFPIAKLLKIGKRAFIIASSEAFGTFVIGFMVGHSVLQYQMFDSLFLALAISVTSTVIIMRILEELNMINDESATEGKIDEGNSRYLIYHLIVRDSFCYFAHT